MGENDVFGGKIENGVPVEEGYYYLRMGIEWKVSQVLQDDRDVAIVEDYEPDETKLVAVYPIGIHEAGCILERNFKRFGWIAVPNPEQVAGVINEND